MEAAALHRTYGKLASPLFLFDSSDTIDLLDSNSFISFHFLPWIQNRAHLGFSTYRQYFTVASMASRKDHYKLAGMDESSTVLVAYTKASTNTRLQRRLGMETDILEIHFSRTSQYCPFHHRQLTATNTAGNPPKSSHSETNGYKVQGTSNLHYSFITNTSQNASRVRLYA